MHTYLTAEVFQVMALRISRDIAKNLQNAVIYTLMADESADVSNKEQLVICIRWVDEDLLVHKDFIGMHPLKGTDADHIVKVLKVSCFIFLLIMMINKSKYIFLNMLNASSFRCNSWIISDRSINNLLVGCFAEDEHSNFGCTWTVLRWGISNGWIKNWSSDTVQGTQ